MPAMNRLTLTRNFQAAVKFAEEQGFKVTRTSVYSAELIGRDESDWTLAAWPWSGQLVLSKSDSDTTYRCKSITQVKTAISQASELCDYLAADENTDG